MINDHQPQIAARSLSQNSQVHPVRSGSSTGTVRTAASSDALGKRLYKCQHSKSIFFFSQRQSARNNRTGAWLLSMDVSTTLRSIQNAESTTTVRSHGKRF